MSGTNYQAFHNEGDSQQTDGLSVQVAGTVPPVGFSGQQQAPPPPYHGQYQTPVPVGGAAGVYHQQPGVPVQGKAEMMPMPTGVPGCPPGLEYLTHLDQLLVHQQIELAEIFLNVEFENKYVVKNSLGQQVYFASEESECCERVWCGSSEGVLIPHPQTTWDSELYLLMYEKLVQMAKVVFQSGAAASVPCGMGIISDFPGLERCAVAGESECCERVWCGHQRGFLFHITDNMGQEVLRVTRQFKCCAGCSWCADNDHCSLFVAVESPPGTVIGYVKQTQSWVSPRFDVLTADQECALKIQGHWCHCQTVCCTEDIEFKIFTNDLQTEVGKVSKQWGGWVRESFTKADNFGVQFPQDMDVKVKATLLASTFLIDFMYFEHRKKNKQY
eukprot:XP_011683187.1 PREDICTED: phospholipid scramblase family member 5 [Strongylocentrotus purpuratus]